MTDAKRNELARALREALERAEETIHAEGRAQGREQSYRKNLLLLLQRRFGALPQYALIWIYRANLEVLEEWFGRAIEAEILDTVFDPELLACKPTAGDQLRADGYRRGRLRGQRENVAQLLAWRLGPLSHEMHTRVYEAEMAELQRWFERGITAPSFDAVFADEPEQTPDHEPRKPPQPRGDSGVP